MKGLGEIHSHQMAFDLLYYKPESRRKNYSIGFPLEEIDKFKWERGPFGDLIYAYYYRRFTIFLLTLLQLKPNLRILNIGCGYGFDEKNLANLYNNLDIWSVDISKEMVSIAMENKCPSKLCLSLAEALPFPDNSFDRIIAREVIEHVLSPEMMMKEIYRCLKPGGSVVITTEFIDSLSIDHLFTNVFYRNWANFMGYNLPKPSYKNNLLSVSEINNLAIKSGLILEKIIWDGAMYQFMGSLLFQKILKSNIISIANLFSRLENMGTIDKFFCDQVKIKFHKRRSDFNENIIPHRVQYLCPSCHGEFKQKFKNIECKSCGKIFPFISKDIPDFILYELILPGKCLNASTHIFEEKLEPKIHFKQMKRHLFKIGDIVIKSIYSFLIL